MRILTAEQMLDVRVKGLVWPTKRFNAESLVKKNYGLTLLQVLAKAEFGTEDAAYMELETLPKATKVVVKDKEEYVESNGTKVTKLIVAIIKNESSYADFPAFASSGDMMLSYITLTKKVEKSSEEQQGEPQGEPQGDAQ